MSFYLGGVGRDERLEVAEEDRECGLLSVRKPLVVRCAPLNPRQVPKTPFSWNAVALLLTRGCRRHPGQTAWSRRDARLDVQFADGKQT